MSKEALGLKGIDIARTRGKIINTRCARSSLPISRCNWGGTIVNIRGYGQWARGIHRDTTLFQTLSLFQLSHRAILSLRSFFLHKKKAFNPSRVSIGHKIVFETKFNLRILGISTPEVRDKDSCIHMQ